LSPVLTYPVCREIMWRSLIGVCGAEKTGDIAGEMGDVGGGSCESFATSWRSTGGECSTAGGLVSLRTVPTPPLPLGPDR
jgi:hypothetical protein